MKNLSLVAFATLLLATPAVAQNPAGANAPKYQVAVVDINYIFKNHPQFREKLESMKGEVQQIEGQLKGSAQELMQIEKARASYKPGSDEFKKADEQLAVKKAQFDLQKQKLQKGFLEKEAQAYYEAYNQVQAEITRYAKHYKIGLVLRFNGEQPDPAFRQSILGAINKAVQYQDSIDITPDIESLVKRAYPAKNPTPPGTSQPSTATNPAAAGPSPY